MTPVGKRTSVYLADDLAAAVAESGLPLTELIRRGLAAAGMTLESRSRSIHTARCCPKRCRGRAVSGVQPPGRRRCPHPGTRVIGGWCAPCGVVVETGGYLPG